MDIIMQIEGKELRIHVASGGDIDEIHIDDRLVDGRTDNPDSDFIEKYQKEIETEATWQFDEEQNHREHPLWDEI